MSQQEPEPHESINLDDYLKACGIAMTGGQAKRMIQTGQVKLNGVVETRRRKKLVPGDVLQVDGQEFPIESDGKPSSQAANTSVRNDGAENDAAE